MRIRYARTHTYHTSHIQICVVWQPCICIRKSSGNADIPGQSYKDGAFLILTFNLPLFTSMQTHNIHDHTHANTHTHDHEVTDPCGFTHANTCTHTQIIHTCSRAHTHTLTHTHDHEVTDPCGFTHANTCTHTQIIHTCSRAHTHTLTHTLTYTHAHTHSHTHVGLPGLYVRLLLLLCLYDAALCPYHEPR